MTRTEDYKFPNQIRRYRLERNLRLRDVQALIGQSCVAHIAHWEKGRKLPSLENAIKLSVAIQCPVEILFHDHYTRIKEEVISRRLKHNIHLQYD